MTKSNFEELFIPYEPIDNLQYGAWGELKGGNTLGNTTPFRFTGRWGGYTDGRLGQVLNWNRWYGPEAGRWLSRDPIGFFGGVNLFSYVGNSSPQFIDFTGLKLCMKNLNGLGDVPVDEELSTLLDLWKLFNAAGNLPDLTFTEAFRTTETQKKYYQDWHEKKNKQLIRVNRPGTSEHESGLAVDVRTGDDFMPDADGRESMKNSQRAGLKWKGVDDYVHWEAAKSEAELAARIKENQAQWNNRDKCPLPKCN